MEFEWDLHKAVANLKKHNVAFSEAAAVFSDYFGITIYDPYHSEDEDRFITIGLSNLNRLLIVSHSDHSDINARQLARREREAYENEIKKRQRR
jgi:uncharacterized protein